MAQALAGLRVLDFSRALAGPFCTQMLGDMGADVLKVEQPGVGDNSRAWGPPFEGGESSYYLSVNRNKRSIALDLRHAAGKQIGTQLIAQSDIVIENFVPGVMERLGLDYAHCRALRPDIIYCAISGFGQIGPQREQPAYDQVLQGLGGLMSVTGEPGAPPTRIGIAIADLMAGMFAAYAISVAALHRERTGEGQMIDTSLLAGQVAMMTYQAGTYFATGVAPRPVGRQHPSIVPYGVYAAADGYVCLCVGTDSHWQQCAHVLGLSDLAADERFRTNQSRVSHRDALNAVLEPALSVWPTVILERRLNEAGVPCGVVRDLAGVFADEQVAALELVQHMSHPTAGTIRVVGPPYRLSATPGTLRTPPPLLGEHTDAVLSALGYTPDTIAALREAGTVG